jgi:hypothetical protein
MFFFHSCFGPASPQLADQSDSLVTPVEFGPRQLDQSAACAPATDKAATSTIAIALPMNPFALTMIIASTSDSNALKYTYHAR